MATPRGFSQPSTSFIASSSQGIHRLPLIAYFQPIALMRIKILTSQLILSEYSSFIFLFFNKETLDFNIKL